MTTSDHALSPADAVEQNLLARMLSRIGLSLCVIFLLLVLARAWPAQLLNPAWQLRLSSILINNGSMPLLGLALIWLAPLLHPGSSRLRRRRDQAATLAVLAALGYLLLIPLQSWAVWNSVNGFRLAQQRQLRTATQRANELRQVMRQARSSAELQQRLLALQGPRLEGLNLEQPLQKLRPELLNQLNRDEASLRQQMQAFPVDQVWMLIQDSLRVVLTALAYAVAFASAARWRQQPLTLMDSWLEKRLKLLLPRMPIPGSSARVDQDYLEAISGPQDSAQHSREPPALRPGQERG